MTHGLDLARIGCSDIPMIVGVDAHATEWRLYNRFKGIPDDRSPDLEDYGELGRNIEEGITRTLCVRRLGLGHDYPLSKPPSRNVEDWARYSLDIVGGAVELGDGWAQVDQPRLFEAKMRSFRQIKMHNWGEDGTDEVPLSLAAQTQAQAAWLRRDRDYWVGTDVPEIDEVLIPVACPGESPPIRLYRVKVRPDLGDALLAEAEAWYRRHVQEGLPPKMDGSSAATAYLLEAYPHATEEEREARETEARLLERIVELREQVKRLELTEACLRNELREAMGDTARVWMRDGPRAIHRERQGRVRSSALIQELAALAELKPAQLEMLENKHRGPTKRVLDVR